MEDDEHRQYPSTSYSGWIGQHYPMAHNWGFGEQYVYVGKNQTCVYIYPDIVKLILMYCKFIICFVCFDK